MSVSFLLFSLFWSVRGSGRFLTTARVLPLPRAAPAVCPPGVCSPSTGARATAAAGVAAALHTAVMAAVRR